MTVVVDKEDFFKAAAIKPRKIRVEGFGDIYIKQLSAGDAIELANVENQSEAILTVVRLGVIDHMGNQLFDKDDVQKLSECRFDLLEKMSEAILVYNEGADPQKKLSETSRS